MKSITSIIFPTLCLLQTIPPAKSNTGELYLPIGSSENAQPTCIDIDSQHTYLCTDTPAKARNALDLTDRGSFINDKHFINLGTTQRLSGSEHEIQKVREVLTDMMKYMDEEVMSRSEYEHVRSTCRNNHELCAFWTSVGECETNRVFMLQNCAAACRLCLLQGTNMVRD